VAEGGEKWLCCGPGAARGKNRGHQAGWVHDFIPNCEGGLTDGETRRGLLGGGKAGSRGQE